VAKRKSKSASQLRKEALQLSQRLARMKASDNFGYASCVTCGKTDYYKNMDGGHFISKGSSSRWALDLRNIHCQCKGCNGFAMTHGTAQIAYTRYMQEEYGDKFVAQMLREKKNILKISTAEYKDMVDDLKIEIKKEKIRLGEC